MKKSVMLLILILVPIVIAQDEAIFKSQYITVNFNISSEVSVIPTDHDYILRYVKADLSYFPYDDARQTVLEQHTTPKANKTNGSLIFKWVNVKGSSLSFEVNTKLKIVNRPYYIPRKIDFPITDLAKGYEQYTKPTQVIDSGDNRIIRLASELANGEDDLFEVAFKVGNWTKKNIQYNLSTLTAEVSQKASWVLENRKGVCDELTSLFIAMLRSLGVPARFIAGYSYTNSRLFQENWGPHGWAEVYFPSYGWVPFDVTYGELGYIDASHIKLKSSLDPNMSSMYYQWRGKYVELETQPLSFNTEIIEAGPQQVEHVKLNAQILRDRVGFGSYNLVEVTVENPSLFYIVEDIIISNTENIETVGDNSQLVLLKPGQKKTMYWILKLNQDLNTSYVYTFPVKVYTTSNISKNIFFESEDNEKFYSLQEMQDYIREETQEEEKIYSTNVELDCNTDKNSYHIYETAQVSCTVRNIGNTLLYELEVCMKDNCSSFDLGISQTERLGYTYKPELAGSAQIKVVARNNEVFKAANLDIHILDEPGIRILGLEFPTNVTYEDEFEIKLELTKSSTAYPRNVEMIFSKGNTAKRYYFNELDNKAFVYQLKGKELKEGTNNFRIDVTWYDNNNKEYTLKQGFEIYREDYSFWKRILTFFRELF